MANMIRFWNWTRKVQLEVMEIACVRVYMCSCLWVCGFGHLCARLPQKRTTISQALTQSPEILSFELMSSNHVIDRNNTKQGRNALLAYRFCLLQKTISPCWLHAEQVQLVHPGTVIYAPSGPLKAQDCDLETPGNSLWDNKFTLFPSVQFFLFTATQIVLVLFAHVFRYQSETPAATSIQWRQIDFLFVVLTSKIWHFKKQKLFKLRLCYQLLSTQEILFLGVGSLVYKLGELIL